MSRLSSYAEGLSNETKDRYKEELSIIGGIDLFLSDVGILADSFPPVESIDTVFTWFFRLVLSQQSSLKHGRP